MPVNTGFVTKEQAKKITGYGDRHLRSILANGSPFLGGRRIETITATKKTKRLGMRHVTLLSLPDLKKLVRNRDYCHQHHPDRLSIREAANHIGVSVKTVRLWCYSGCPHLGGRKPDAIKGYTVYRGQRQKSLLLSYADVNVIREKLLHAGERPYQDDEGAWLPLSLALRRFPHARKVLLCEYRNKSCPQLGGNILRARRIRGVVKKTLRESTVWAFLEEDLKRLAYPRKGLKPSRLRPSLHPHRDKKGRVWLPVALICPRFGITPTTLTNYRKGGRLKGRQIRCTYLGKRVWFYPESDLKELVDQVAGDNNEAGVMPSACREGGNPETLPTQPHPVYIVQPVNQPVPVQIAGRENPNLTPPSSAPVVLGARWTDTVLVRGTPKKLPSFAAWKLVRLLLAAGPEGLSKDELEAKLPSARQQIRLLCQDPDWVSVIPKTRAKGERYRLLW